MQSCSCLVRTIFHLQFYCVLISNLDLLHDVFFLCNNCNLYITTSVFGTRILLQWKINFDLICRIIISNSCCFLSSKVHITQGNHDGSAMIVSWVTEAEPGSSKVLYGTDSNKLIFSAEGKHTRYEFYNYTSGYIHHCTIRKLKVIE